MYILKNAYLAISRNKGRNILIGIIIVVISCACTVTLAIRNSANSLIDSYKEEYEIVASIGTNRQKMMEGFEPGSNENEADIEDIRERFNNIESIAVSDVDTYGNSKYVKSYYYTNSLGLDGNDIDPATISNTSSKSSGGNRGSGMFVQNMETSAEFSLTGYSSLTAMTDFIEGNYNITSGSIFTDFSDYSCVINEELANLNGLSVNDKITLVNPDNSKQKYELTITGIYKENDENTQAGGMISMFSNSVNNIITSSTVVNDIYEDDTDLKLTVTPKFILTGEDVVEGFANELTEKGLSEYLSVTTNLSEAEESVKSVENVKTYATTFLIITLIIGSIVLLILNMINVRERKYEIGVLRTIGMKKSLLSLQFAFELLIIAVVSLSLGGLIGSSMSVKTANSLLASEIESSNSQKETAQGNFGPSFSVGGRGELNKINGIANVSAFTSIDAIVDYKVLLQLLGIGVFLTIISSTVAMVNIQRFSPLSILKERS